jgi:hypothetical protein
MKYAIYKHSENEVDIILEDGGVATVHHNGEHLLTTYYQDRVHAIDDEMWDVLADGNTYTKDWNDKQVVDAEVIDDAIDWLCPFTSNVEEVSYESIKEIING